MWNAPGLSRCSSLRTPWPKPTGVLEHCCEGETNSFSVFFGAFPSDRIPKEAKYFPLLAVAIPVNYTSKFRELSEVTTYQIPFIVINRRCA
jgi:hypothetical protein